MRGTAAGAGRVPDLEAVARQARAHFRGAGAAHDWAHVERVRALAVRLAEEEGADREVVELAALLHDVGRALETRSGEDHAGVALKVAGKLLAGHPRRAAVLEAIGAHRFRGSRRPAWPEGRVLYDADKLDAIGAVGVGRAFATAAELGLSLEDAEREFFEKLRRIRFYTGAARRVAAGRRRAMRAFFKRFRRELDGEA